MPRKTNRLKLKVFDTEIQAEEQYYLGNPLLPTSQSKYEWTEDMVQAYKRCKEDIIYFAENFFVIIAAGKRILIPLREYQKDFLRATMENKRILALYGRQSSKTTLMTIYALWLATFFPDQFIIICAHKGSVAKMILERIKLAYQELPGWIKEPIIEWNKSSLKFNNGSSISAENTTAEGPRGNSLSCLILDEFAFVAPEIASKFWTSVTPTLVENPDARMFVSSTPNGVGNMFWELYDKTIKKENEFVLKKVTWRDVPGRDEAWKKRTIETDCLGDTERFEQEYECRFIGSSNSPFPPEMFTKIEKDICQPKYLEMDGHFKIWKLPELDRVYTIGVDVSEGIGSDYSVVQVFDLTDLNNIEQVACYSHDMIDPTSFTDIVLEIAKMYGNPVMCIERNGCGSGVCDRIAIDNSYPHMVSYGNEKHKKSRFGINSNGPVKYSGVITMKYWVADKRRVAIRDKKLLEEFRHFEKNSNKWGATSGYHDDLVMSAVWALFPLYRNIINQFFKIEKVGNDGMPMAIKNIFNCQIDISNSSLASKYAQYSGFGIISFNRKNVSQYNAYKQKYPMGWSENIFNDIDKKSIRELQQDGWKLAENPKKRPYYRW